jgi:hypothetical protein
VSVFLVLDQTRKNRSNLRCVQLRNRSEPSFLGQQNQDMMGMVPDPFRDRPGSLHIDRDLKHDMKHLSPDIFELLEQSGDYLEDNSRPLIIVEKDLFVVHQQLQEKIGMLIDLFGPFQHVGKDVEQSYRIFLGIFKLLLG